MWKIFVAFIAFAAIALYFISQGGDKVDMAGEAGHGVPSAEHDTAPATAPATATPAAPASEAK